MSDQSFDLSHYSGLPELLRADPLVTTSSKWSDRVWRLEGDIPGVTQGHFALHWPDLPRNVLIPLKWLAARCFIGRYNQRLYKASTAGTFSAGARFFARFLNSEEYADLSRLDEVSFEDFKDYLYRSILDEEEEGVLAADSGTFDEEDSPGSFDADSELGRAQAYYRLRIWKLLADFRLEMKQFGLPALSFNPFKDQSSTALAKQLATKAAEEVPPLPDEVALPILAAALRMIGQPAEDVITLQSGYLSRLQKMDREPPTAERRTIQKYFENFSFSAVDGEAQPWRSPIRLPPGQEGGGDLLRELIEDVRNACVIILMGLTGIRISEALSIVSEPRDLVDDGTQLPSCITTIVSKSGLSQLYLLHGLHTKHEEKPRPETWLAGSRPQHSQSEPLVVQAIRVLERLYEPWRRFSTDEKLSRGLLISFLARGLPRKPESVGLLTGAVTREGMRSFIRKHVDLSHLAHLTDEKPHLERYRLSDGQCVHPHQWRKTFLKYAMRIDPRMAPAVSQHFKHLNLTVTERDYAPKDIGLLLETDNMQLRETAIAIRKAVTGKSRPIARMDKAIAAARSDLERFIPDLEAASLQQFEDFAIRQDLRIWYAPHGRCLIALNPDEARCHDAAGTTAWSSRAPNPLTRTPGLCLGCANFSISPHSAGFWRARYIENQKSWLASGKHLSFRVAQRRAQQAEAVLAALNEPIPDLDEEEHAR